MLLNGVRKAAIATAGGSGAEEMERTMAVSLRESVQLVSDPRNLDASVEEVFQLMLGIACRRDPGPAVIEPESVSYTHLRRAAAGSRPMSRRRR